MIHGRQQQTRRASESDEPETLPSAGEGSLAAAEAEIAEASAAFEVARYRRDQAIKNYRKLRNNASMKAS